jgi:hypothetical protein
MRAHLSLSSVHLTFAAVFFLAGAAAAQSADYDELVRHAGIIFRGRVEAVEHLPAMLPDGIPALRITFRVQHAARGAIAGQTLTTMQWDAPANAPEYRIGEELGLLLYPPSGELGFTSPVGGHRGRLRVEEYNRLVAMLSQTRDTSQGERSVKKPVRQPRRHAGAESD